MRSQGAGAERVYAGMAKNKDIHVMPLNDLVEHLDNRTCICGPTETTPGVLVHHSLDGREMREPGYTGPSMPKEKSAAERANINQENDMAEKTNPEDEFDEDDEVDGEETDLELGEDDEEDEDEDDLDDDDELDDEDDEDDEEDDFDEPELDEDNDS